MEVTEKTEALQKNVKMMLDTILLIIDKSEININITDKKLGRISNKLVIDILKEKNILEEVKASKDDDFTLTKRYIKISEFINENIFYKRLYEFFLNVMKTMAKKQNDLNIFESFNQLYFYKKYIKYLLLFVEKHPDKLRDDIIKEKLYEIVHFLYSKDKLYNQDFYFFISIYHVQNTYKYDDMSIPEFEQLKTKNLNNIIKMKVLNIIRAEKINIICDFISLLLSDNELKESELYNLAIKAQHEIYSNPIFITNEEDFSKIKWDNIILESEKKFIHCLKEDNNLKKNHLFKYIEKEPKLKKLYEFYYLNEMKSFLSLGLEEKYIFINSFYLQNSSEFSELNLEFTSSLESYKEGIENANEFEKTIKEIIEKKEFYELMKEILISKKVMDYIKNPSQYCKNINTKDINEYQEKKEDEKKYKNRKIYQKKVKNEKIKISKFDDNLKEEEDLDTKDKENDTEDFFDFLNWPNSEDDKKDFKCQFEEDYEYFIKHVFKDNFFKKRIIYSYLSVGIKAIVYDLPKIILNICGNNIISNKINKNGEDYKTIIKALLVIILLHKIIHLIRRENEKKEIRPMEFTPERNTFEGGQSFIYYIFGDFVVKYIDLNFAIKILDIVSWGENKENKNVLKEEFDRLNKKDNVKIKDMENDSWIKCYSSGNEKDDKDKNEEEVEYYCYGILKPNH